MAIASSLLVATSLSLAAAEAPVFVQGSSLYVRQAPSTRASKLTELPINAPVLLEEKGVGDDGGWCAVQWLAGAPRGFVRCDMLGPTKVELAAVLQIARSTELPITETHPAAQRALALAPDDREVRALFVERFWAYEAHLLSLARAAGTLNRKRPTISTERRGSGDPDEKIAWACGEVEGECVVAEGFPGCTFACAGLRGDTLTVHSGAWCCDCEEEGAITLERTSTMKASPRALAALFAEMPQCLAPAPPPKPARTP